MSSVALKCQNLTRIFKRTVPASGFYPQLKAFISPKYVEKIAVDNISFEIQTASCVGMVGANGAGKTTFLKMAAGLLHPSSGDIEVLGYKPSDRDKKFLSSIGMVMGQKSQLWADIPALETLTLLGAIYSIPAQEALKRIHALAEIFSVGAHLNVQVRKLSLGERMKFEIMAALLHKPQFLFLDEPTIGLDLVAQKSIRTLIKNLNQQEKVTVVLSSHDMSDISETCDSLLIINQGKLLFDGKLEEFGRHDLSHRIHEILVTENKEVVPVV